MTSPPQAEYFYNGHLFRWEKVNNDPNYTSPLDRIVQNENPTTGFTLIKDRGGGYIDWGIVYLSIWDAEGNIVSKKYIRMDKPKIACAIIVFGQKGLSPLATLRQWFQGVLEKNNLEDLPMVNVPRWYLAVSRCGGIGNAGYW